MPLKGTDLISAAVVVVRNPNDGDGGGIVVEPVMNC
ncbi:hypothetical protein M8C21_002706 [Ambrosia artemisiifolia]|uniref:Uncharacterized protein n=1 Tax=Ambrosia artemisiifolia TaxID=4212 RepID=A0AAD5G6N8_AMBAR|nr:hypothetical protein M8C21_002706 [Ambrosia artemisiifolia]